MKTVCVFLTVFTCLGSASSQSDQRRESEYYVCAYALHYRIPVQFVRALIAQESGWKPCVFSEKGAAGLMQLMPETARRFGVGDRCDVRQNVSAGVRYLAHLLSVYKGDLRLVAAAYVAGERRVTARGLDYSNPQVIAYVRQIHARLASDHCDSDFAYKEGTEACH